MLDANTGAILSLIFIIAVIALSFIKNVNIGLCAVAIAFIIGRLGGMTDKAIVKGFNTSLFVMLLGVTFFFGLLQENKTLPKLINRLVWLTRKQSYLLTPMIFLIAALLSAMGPGPLPVMSIMIPIAVSIAASTGYSPAMLAAAANLGASAGGMTPVSSNGIVVINLMAEQGYFGFETALIFGTALRKIVQMSIIYFLFKGYKKTSVDKIELSSTEQFTSQNWVSVCLTLILLIAVIFGGCDVGLTSFLMGVILLLLFPMEQKKIFSAIPWSTLIMISGMSVYMNIMQEMGGVDLLSNTLSSIMTPTTANPIMCVISGVLSWFSSTIGVVLPAMIPLIPKMIGLLGGSLTAEGMCIAVVNGSTAAGLSPMSSAGGLSMGAFSTFYKPSDKETRKYFVTLFLLSCGNLIFAAIWELVIMLI